jgi:hypothetical protein
MAKTKISEFDTTPGLNTDINSIDIDEGMPPSSVNNAIRQLMSYIKDALFQTLTVAGILSVDDTTDSTSGTTGSIHTDGGLGVAKSIYCEETLITPQWTMYNALDNGDFRVDQRMLGISYTSTSAFTNAAGNYILDRWVLVSDGDNVFDVTQRTTFSELALGAYAGIRLDVETEDKKGGIFQIIEARETERLFKAGAGVVSLSFSAETTDATNYTKIRAAVLAWDGTADAPTIEPIADGSWGAENTNPTLVSNWTYENTPAALTALTTSVQRLKIENISLNTTSTNNLGVLIWMDDMTNDAVDRVIISDVQLNPGAKALPFIPKSYGEELRAVQRFMKKWQNDESNNEMLPAVGGSKSTTGAQTTLQFPVEMIGEPTLQVSDVTHFDVGENGSYTVTTAISLNSGGSGRSAGRLDVTTAGSLTDNSGVLVRFEGTETGGTQWLLVTAEF